MREHINGLGIVPSGFRRPLVDRCALKFGWRGEAAGEGVGEGVEKGGDSSEVGCSGEREGVGEVVGYVDGMRDGEEKAPRAGKRAADWMLFAVALAVAKRVCGSCWTGNCHGSKIGSF